MQKDLVENTVTNFVSKKLNDQDYLKALIGQAFSKSQIKETENQSLYLKQELSRLKKKKSKLLDLYSDGLFTKEELNQKVSTLNDEISVGKVKLAKLERHEVLKQNIIARQNIEPIVRTLTEFPYWTPVQKRTFLQSQIPEFSITKKGITGFTLNFCKLGDHTGMDSWRPPA